MAGLMFLDPVSFTLSFVVFTGPLVLLPAAVTVMLTTSLPSTDVGPWDGS